MGISFKKMYPKVFKSHTHGVLNFELADTDIDASLFTVKIQPLEAYSIPHSENFGLKEEERYPYLPVTVNGGVFSVGYDFTAEQLYSVKVKYGDEVVLKKHVFAVDEDLARLKPLKGDTHLHTNRSDGQGEPFEVATTYRKAGFDFICVTDHHRYAPSLEAKEQVSALTDEFFVFPGEEVHNKGGYFHIINFGGGKSVNDIVKDEEYASAEIEKILNSNDFSGLSHPKYAAYRMFIADEIRKVGGIAIMSHPFWEAYGEYNMQVEDFNFHWKNGHFDAFEVVAGCDYTGQGNNLQEMLRVELLSMGYKVPVVGASDAHSTRLDSYHPFFNSQYTVVFAEDFSDVPDAIKQERAVAVEHRSEKHYYVVGKYRYANYARFLLNEYFLRYAKLTDLHGAALFEKDTEAIRDTEQKTADFKREFFAF